MPYEAVSDNIIITFTPNKGWKERGRLSRSIYFSINFLLGGQPLFKSVPAYNYLTLKR